MQRRKPGTGAVALEESARRARGDPDGGLDAG